MKELDLNENSSKSLLTIVLDMADDFNFDDNDDGSWWWHEWYCFQNKMKELDLKEKSSKSLLANVLDMDDDYRPSSTLPQVFPQHHHDQHQQHHHDQHQHQHQHLIMMNILSIQASITQATPARIRMVASSGNLTHHLYKKNIFYRLLPPPFLPHCIKKITCVCDVLTHQRNCFLEFFIQNALCPFQPW